MEDYHLNYSRFDTLIGAEKPIGIDQVGSTVKDELLNPGATTYVF